MRAFHVTSSRNRTSIQDRGLDWHLMGAAPGIAGSRTVEVHGIYLCTERSEADFFVRMNNTGGALDLWAVEGVEPSELLDNGSGFAYVTSKVPPHRLELIETDLSQTAPIPAQPSEGSDPEDFTIEDSAVVQSAPGTIGVADDTDMEVDEAHRQTNPWAAGSTSS